MINAIFRSCRECLRPEIEDPKAQELMEDVIEIVEDIAEELVIKAIGEPLAEDLYIIEDDGDNNH